MKSGFVSLIGRPNTGKSTLLNTIIGEKITIMSDKPGTTRNLINGIYTNEDVQIVFVDTPGIHKPMDKMGHVLNAQAYYSINDVDALLLVIDASSKLGKGDNYLLDKLKGIKKPVLLVMNKIDKLTRQQLLEKIDECKNIYPFAEIIPVSALKNDNVDRLIKVVSNYLPDNVKYYSEGEKTTSELDFRLAEIVREKIFIHTKDEVPHSVSCKLTNYYDEKNEAFVYVDIIVDRDSLKKIILGKGGSMIKTIGIEARLEMEKVLNKKVYLELYCRTLKKWRTKEKYIKELGYLNNNE